MYLSTVLSITFFVVGLGLTYFLIRPLLKARPSFKDFYAYTDSKTEAVRLKLRTIKTKITAILLMWASVLVGMHDFVLPIATGIDWTPITKDVPAAVWPIASFAMSALFYYLRTLTEKTQAQVEEGMEEGKSVTEAKVDAGVLPQSSLDGEGEARVDSKESK